MLRCTMVFANNEDGFVDWFVHCLFPLFCVVETGKPRWIGQAINYKTIQRKKKVKKVLQGGNSGLMIMDYQNNPFRDGLAKKEFVRLKQMHNWRNCTKY